MLNLPRIIALKIAPSNMSAQIISIFVVGVHVKSIGVRLKGERERLKLSQEAIATSSGITRRTQQLYESGGTQPSANYLVSVAKLGVDVSYILFGEERYKYESVKNNANLEVASPVMGKGHTVNYDELIRRLTMTPSDSEGMGERIRNERKFLHMSTGVMASMCHVSEETWKKYESGELPIDESALHQFTFLGGDLFYIMTGMRDLYTSKNMTETRLLMYFRQTPIDRRGIALEYVKENSYREGDDDLPQEKRGGMHFSQSSK